MVDRYNTGDPRPSNSMKNLSDNALAFDDFVNSDGDNAVDRFGKEFPTISKLIKNVDEIFSSQLSIQESTFSESQTDKENRFQQFLNTSGYVFLGDYQDGPFQFSARNQYIRYDNEYYRLNAATDVGFTTTGTDATSFANDVTHFVLMDGDTLRQNLSSINLPGTSLVIGADGASVDQAIKFVTPLLKPGIENAEYNYTVIQAAANKNRHLDLPKGDYYISQAFQAGKGQIIRGQGSPNFSPNCYTRLICMTEGEGCIWYTQDTSTGQVRMPQIYDMGLTGDYPVRFNNEQTAIIKDDTSLSNVPFGMVPKVINCAINPRVNGVGIGISWSKMFDGIITCCEVANFDIDLLLNGCDLNWVAHNRIRNGWRYMILELSASTFGSQNIIYHNDVLHVGSPNCIMIKSTARHARIIDNYLEQATGTDGQALIGFIDATDVDAPSYAGNVSAGRYSTILRDNRIDGFSKAKNFVYKYQPKGQTYGEIVDVSTVGSNVGLGSNALTLVDETGATVDNVPLLYNQQQPCSFVFKGPRFGKWNGYTSEGQFADVINGLNVGAFGTSLYGNLLSNYLRARGNEMVLMAGFSSTGIFSYAASSGLFEPERSYIIEVEAYCASGTEDFTFGGIVSGAGKVSTTFTLSTTPRKMRVEFVTGIAGSSNGIYFSRSNNGSDIIIKRIRFLKKYLQENAMSASSSKTLQITTQSGEIQIAANGGYLYPVYKVLKFINGYLVETFSQVNNATLIDVTWTYSSGSLTVNVTGSGGSKQLAISQISQPG
ncbi:endo-N-neuraminidase [Klebsiella quasipneumoniae subsp. similipneumoniae]|uniref:endo-N-neuraminidase n=1 Tax=Klebsiella quasipneumoniae TaxID=1463165 RepID=UPI00292C8BA8|nr:endo-N-neuraminidase [Klebsiella quasipneumoniae]MDV1351693.1 endo-N-neuraminidase [Klebsiella quasipneumoniae subsp. similipneumoniae]MDV1366464.1 endo-N-neuraminidase [Klebsiella quasipneumoniae subsp. similipneumoniae]